MKNILNILRWVFYSYFLVGFFLSMLVKYNFVTLKNSLFYVAYEVLSLVGISFLKILPFMQGFPILSDLIILVLAITILYLIGELIWTLVYGMFARKK